MGKLEIIKHPKHPHHHRQNTMPIKIIPPLPPSPSAKKQTALKRHHSTISTKADWTLQQQHHRRLQDIELDKTMAIKKVIRVLHEVDEDGDGNVDYMEFEEALKNINHNLLPSQIEQMYQDIVGPDIEENELSISL